jgi:hypothetical protein
MKTLHILSGVVVGAITVNPSHSVIVNAPEGATTLHVNDDHPATTRWLVSFDGAGVPTFTDPGPEIIVPAAISRLKLILGMVADGLITAAEGEAAAANTAIPALIAGVFATLPPTQATEARIRWASMAICDRANPLVNAVAAAGGLTSDEMDYLFIEWNAVQL